MKINFGYGNFIECPFGEIFEDKEGKIFMKIPMITDKEGNQLGNAITMKEGYLEEFMDNASILRHPDAQLTL